MDMYFCNAYKRLEKEVVELSEYIHISAGCASSSVNIFKKLGLEHQGTVIVILDEHWE